jgi:Rrf2 family iron-sulfur cluster assembly transcriptional regulator
MRVTQWGELGVLCAIELAKTRSTTSLSAADLAEALKIDVQYAQQILHRLKCGAVIESIRGPKGGYKLKKNAAQISLKEIIYAAEGETFEVFCEAKILDEERCNPVTNACNLRPIWYRLRQHIDQFLEDIALSDLLNSPVENILVQISSGKLDGLESVRNKANSA